MDQTVFRTEEREKREPLNLRQPFGRRTTRRNGPQIFPHYSRDHRIVDSNLDLYYKFRPNFNPSAKENQASNIRHQASPNFLKIKRQLATKAKMFMDYEKNAPNFVKKKVHAHRRHSKRSIPKHPALQVESPLQPSSRMTILPRVRGEVERERVEPTGQLTQGFGLVEVSWILVFFVIFFSLPSILARFRRVIAKRKRRNGESQRQTEQLGGRRVQLLELRSVNSSDVATKAIARNGVDDNQREDRTIILRSDVPNDSVIVATNEPSRPRVEMIRSRLSNLLPASISKPKNEWYSKFVSLLPLATNKNNQNESSVRQTPLNGVESEATVDQELGDIAQDPNGRLHATAEIDGLFPTVGQSSKLVKDDDTIPDRNHLATCETRAHSANEPATTTFSHQSPVTHLRGSPASQQIDFHKLTPNMWAQTDNCQAGSISDCSSAMLSSNNSPPVAENLHDQIIPTCFCATRDQVSSRSKSLSYSPYHPLCNHNGNYQQTPEGCGASILQNDSTMQPPVTTTTCYHQHHQHYDQHPMAMLPNRVQSATSYCHQSDSRNNRARRQYENYYDDEQIDGIYNPLTAMHWGFTAMSNGSAYSPSSGQVMSNGDCQSCNQKQDLDMLSSSQCRDPMCVCRSQGFLSQQRATEILPEQRSPLPILVQQPSQPTPTPPPPVASSAVVTSEQVDSSSEEARLYNPRARTEQQQAALSMRRASQASVWASPTSNQRHYSIHNHHQQAYDHLPYDHCDYYGSDGHSPRGRAELLDQVAAQQSQIYGHAPDSTYQQHQRQSHHQHPRYYPVGGKPLGSDCTSSTGSSSGLGMSACTSSPTASHYPSASLAEANFGVGPSGQNQDQIGNSGSTSSSYATFGACPIGRPIGNIRKLVQPADSFGNCCQNRKFSLPVQLESQAAHRLANKSNGRLLFERNNPIIGHHRNSAIGNQIPNQEDARGNQEPVGPSESRRSSQTITRQSSFWLEESAADSIISLTQPSEDVGLVLDEPLDSVLVEGNLPLDRPEGQKNLIEPSSAGRQYQLEESLGQSVNLIDNPMQETGDQSTQLVVEVAAPAPQVASDSDLCDLGECQLATDEQSTDQPMDSLQGQSSGQSSDNKPTTSASSTRPSSASSFERFAFYGRHGQMPKSARAFRQSSSSTGSNTSTPSPDFGRPSERILSVGQNSSSISKRRLFGRLRGNRRQPGGRLTSSGESATSNKLLTLTRQQLSAPSEMMASLSLTSKTESPLGSGESSNGASSSNVSLIGAKTATSGLGEVAHRELGLEFLAAPSDRPAASLNSASLERQCRDLWKLRATLHDDSNDNWSNYHQRLNRRYDSGYKSIENQLSSSVELANNNSSSSLASGQLAQPPIAPDSLDKQSALERPPSGCSNMNNLVAAVAARSKSATPTSRTPTPTTLARIDQSAPSSEADEEGDFN